MAGDDAVQILAHADIAEIGAGIRRIGIGPKTAAMAELDVRIALGDGKHMRVEIAEGRREQELRVVEIDHRFHRPLHRLGLRHVLFFRDRDARHQLDGRRTLGVGLVVAIVVARPDIDEADGEIGLCEGAADPERADGGQSAKGGAGAKNVSTGRLGFERHQLLHR